MKILSINFGHDASICLMIDGRLVEFSELERESRLKHHYGLHSSLLEAFLERASHEFQDIDLVAVSGTQQWALCHSDDIELTFGESTTHSKWKPVKFNETWNKNNYNFHAGFVETFYKSHVDHFNLVRTPSPVRKSWQIPVFTDFHSAKTKITEICKAAEHISKDDISRIQSQFITPYTFRWNNIEKPAFYIEHHYCHAAYASFYSYSKALTITHDGGVPSAAYNSGGLYLSSPRYGALPILSHGLSLGNIYDKVAFSFGLDAGKLMGLASYARPNVYIKPIITTYTDKLYHGGKMNANAIAQSILASAQHEFNIKEQYLNEYQFDFTEPKLAIQSAANTQAFVQEVYATLIGEIAEKIFETDTTLNQAYMTGGFALNCPTNTLMNQQSTTINFRPLPGVGDTGLAVGAAAAVCQFVGESINDSDRLTPMAAAFPPSSLDHNVGFEDTSGLEQLDIKSLPAFIATVIAEGAVVCIHRGRSEVGPRALGRRSIIAWAGLRKNLNRINEHKGREKWRPLAPICLESDFNDFFIGDPDEAKYMLTVAKVKSDKIPAITHVDNTARVQVLDANDTLLTEVLNTLKKNGNAPVLINTSFNCNGEPLVETFAHAKRSFLKMKFDYLITEMGVFKAA